MEVSAINTSPKLERKGNFRRNVAASVLGGMGIGALVNGAELTIWQKAVLQNKDKFMKCVKEEMEANADNKELQRLGHAVKQDLTDFVNHGKVDKKAVFRYALKGALSVGLLFGTLTTISHLIKNHKIEKAEKTNNPKKA